MGVWAAVDAHPGPTRTMTGQSPRLRRMLHAKAELAKLLSAAEERRGNRYSRVIYTRLDTQWLADFPSPLKIPSHENANSRPHRLPIVWIPESMDYYGLNDRIAVLPRSMADWYLTKRWYSFESGKLLNAAVKQGITLRGEGISTEIACKLLLEGHLDSNAENRTWIIGRFLPIAAVLCDEEEINASTVLSSM